MRKELVLFLSLIISFKSMSFEGKVLEKAKEVFNQDRSAEVFRYGLVGGGNFNLLASDTDANGAIDGDEGMRVGLQAVYQLSDSFKVIGSLIYDEITLESGTNDARVNEDYGFVSLIPRLGYQVSDGPIFFQLGTRLSAGISSNSEVDSEFGTFQGNPVEENSFTYGAVVGFGADFNYKSIKIMPEILYDYGLNEINSIGEAREVNRVIAQLGILY